MNQLTLAPITASASALNQGQQDAADAFFQFLFSPEKEMGISGPGGVGKTFLMDHMIDVVMPRYLDTCKMMGIEPEFVSIEMTATTNKAAEQLSLATKKPCSTLASFLGLRVTNDFKTGATKLTPNNKWKVHENLVIFVDECSMIDSGLNGWLMKGTNNCKIIYVGDHCQLAPVMETLSPVYRKGITFHNLTEPMRTKVPELQALNTQLRSTVETGIFNPIKLVPGIIDHFDEDQMEAQINKAFLDQDHDDRILAYTNKRVIQFNDHIRSLRNLPDEITVGENLINSNALHLKNCMVSVEKELTVVSIDSEISKFTARDAEVEYRLATLRGKNNEMYFDVKLPVDTQHFLDVLKYLGNVKDWAALYSLKDYYADLRPRDASTVHKAQGSTFNTTFIDLGNISTCTKPNEAARMLYVACSRSRSRIVFYGELAAKYGGLIQ